MVYVITHDVVRSGATSLPEVLRLAPNPQLPGAYRIGGIRARAPA
jgi:hypothetical protein